MIRRNVTRYTKNQESLEQSSFTAMKGIDSTKAPTQPDTVLDAVNLDVDYDGGLILRKPLTLCKKFSTSNNIWYMGYTYDKSILLIIGDNAVNVNIKKFIFTDIFGVKHTIPEQVSYKDMFNFEDCKVINTPTSTLIINVLTNLKYIFETHGVKVYNANVEPDEQVRILKLYYKDDEWVLEMLTPEINTVSSETLAIDFNTTLYNPLAIRDDYASKVTTVQGILGYVNNTPLVSKTHSKTTTLEPIVDYLVDIPNFAICSLMFANNEYGKMSVSGMFQTVGFIVKNLKETYILEDVKFIFKTESNQEVVVQPYTVNNDSSISLVNFGDVQISSNSLDFNRWVSITVEYTVKTFEDKTITIDRLTESNAEFAIVDTVENNPGTVIVLKAFLNNPVQPEDTETVLFGIWERSLNGIDWERADIASTDYPYDEQTPVYTYEINVNEINADKTIIWKSKKYYRLDLPEYKVAISNSEYSIFKRPDCLTIENIEHNLQYMYRFTVIQAAKTSKYEPPEDAPEDFWCKTLDVDSKVYYFKKNTFEPVSLDTLNPILGKSIYWKNSLYSISPEFKNNIYASNPDSAVFPISRIIDLGTFEGNTVTKLIPWRDYLIAFTNSTVHLINEQEYGFTTKVINTFIGASERDADTCVATLNGIVFKSGSKLYSIVPNYNSGDETIFNISEISKSVEHLLEKLTYNEKYKPFAFTTPEAYYLFVPKEKDTFCLKYNYTLRTWAHYEYPIVLYKYEMLDVSDIRVFSKSEEGITEYYFEKEPDNLNELQPYGDFLTTETTSDGAYVVTPISFSVDSGQKTDNLVLTKQFVESKIIVATLSNKDSFAMNVQIAVDGTVFNKHIDVATDGALLRNAEDQIITLGTTHALTNADDMHGTMRQMFIRYSGKGKTIRHIISGESLHKFKIYETLYRYKILNVKQ